MSRTYHCNSVKSVGGLLDCRSEGPLTESTKTEAKTIINNIQQRSADGKKDEKIRDLILLLVSLSALLLSLAAVPLWKC